MSEYHSRDGFHFSRDNESNPPGAVRIRKATNQGVTLHEVTLPPNEWASVVASMSKAGEDGVTYRAALDFHQADGHERS